MSSQLLRNVSLPKSLDIQISGQDAFDRQFFLLNLKMLVCQIWNVQYKVQVHFLCVGDKLSEWMARPVPAFWSHCSTANDTKAKTSLIMTETQPLNTSNSDQAVKPRKSGYQVTIRLSILPVEDTAEHSLSGDIKVMRLRENRKKLKLLFSAPNTADSCPSANFGPYCPCLHVFTWHWKKNGSDFCLIIYMVILSYGTLWRHKQQCMGLNNPVDWHLCIDFYSNLLRPYLDFRGLVRSRGKCQHKIHQQYKSLQADE